MRGLRQYEKDETGELNRLIQEMNHLHAVMGGRDSRPERKALVRCMAILMKTIQDYHKATLVS